MSSWMIVILAIGWSVIGFGLAYMLMGSEGLEYVNPIWIYKKYRVNYFGAAVLCILFNLICPIGSICYWFYKLCTVGRK